MGQNFSFAVQAASLLVAVIYPSLLLPSIAVISVTYLLSRLTSRKALPSAGGGEGAWEEENKLLSSTEKRAKAFLRINESIRTEIIPVFTDHRSVDMTSNALGHLALGAANSAGIANKTTLKYNIDINELNFVVKAECPNSQNAKKIKLIKVDRALHQYHDTPYLSSIADNPADEDLLLRNGTSRPLISSNSRGSLIGRSPLRTRLGGGEPANITDAIDEDTLVSGDIVKVMFVGKRRRGGEKLLTVKEEWWLGAVLEKPASSSFFGGTSSSGSGGSGDRVDPNQESRSLFMLTVIDEGSGEAVYGVPLSSGLPFRLRSARWPRYEAGYQLSGGDELMLYEWSPRHHRKPIKWQFGGAISPLVLCALSRSPREIRRHIDWGKCLYFRLSSLFYRNHDLQCLELSLVGWGEVVHRSLLAAQKVVFLRLCYVSNACSTHSDTLCVRQDLLPLLQTLDEKVKYSAHYANSARGSGARAPLASKHETQCDASVRHLHHRVKALQHYIRGGQRYSREAAARLVHYCKEPQSWDSFLLSGSPNQLSRKGGVPFSVHSSIVLRPSWGSNWNEEIAVLSTLKIDFYTPFSNTLALTVPLSEVTGASRMSVGNSPLPGVHFLRIETMPLVHYIGFSDRAALLAMEAALLDEIRRSATVAGKMGALFFNSGRWLPRDRKVLNARRLVFDTATGGCGAALLAVAAASRRRKTEAYLEASYMLLREVFELDPLSNEDYREQTINERPVSDENLDIARLTAFFDEVAALRLVDLSVIDCDSHEAVCFFCNMYSILLMHARLVNGAPSTGAHWKMFFETFSYEIGDDVFSLCEIEQCVIRGLLCRPKYSAISDSKNIRPTVAADDDHFRYALPKVDFRINFLLTNGTVSYPNKIYLLTPDSLNKKLDLAAQEMLEAAFRFDPAKKTIIFPKICKYYGEDFGDDIVKKCTPYVSLTKGGAHLLNYLSVHGSANMNIVYRDYFYQSHDRMRLVT